MGTLGCRCRRSQIIPAAIHGQCPMRILLRTSLDATLGVALGLVFTTAVLAQSGDAAKWAELQRKAKEEGQVVVAGPPFQGLRTALTAAFKQRFGIELNYLGMFAGEVITRVDTES